MWSTAKRLVKWAWQNDYIDKLPKNIDDREMSISVRPTKINVFTREEVKTILESSCERGALYWLLMLNTGMQQNDIATMVHNCIDWTNGRIIRKRNKTESYENVPTVEYLLWSRSLELLRKFSTPGDPILKNIHGGRLVHEQIVDGRLKRTDAIKNLFFRLNTKLNINKPLKLFRKTGASYISEHFGESATQLYLGHAPKTVAQRHYVKPAQTALDEALRAMEDYFLGE